MNSNQMEQYGKFLTPCSCEARVAQARRKIREGIWELTAQGIAEVEKKRPDSSKRMQMEES